MTSVVVLDYGVKRNILRALTSIVARATVLPATTTAEEVLARLELRNHVVSGEWDVVIVD